LTPQTGDVIVVASKIVSIAEGRLIPVNSVRPSKFANLLGAKWNIDKRFSQIIVDEADAILGGVNGFVLTIKHGILTPNAGVDQKNAPPGTVAAWPKSPDATADRVRVSIWKQFRARVGVEIVDSRVTALRMGTTGLAIGISGFSPVRDERGSKDIYGRVVRTTQTNVADDIASASHMVMGERDERVGLVLVRGARIHLGNFSSELARLKKQDCLVAAKLRIEAISAIS